MSQIKGILSYKSERFPFEYSDCVLSLFPPTDEALNRSKFAIFDQWAAASIPSADKSFIEYIDIYGETSKGETIQFSVRNDPTNSNGFIDFDVSSVFCYQKQRTEFKGTPFLHEENKPVDNHIRGFILLGMK